MPSRRSTDARDFAGRWGGASSAMPPRMVRLLHRQIAHLRAGEEPENLVVTGT